MSQSIKDFKEQFQRSVRWNNRAEKELANFAKELADGLNEILDGDLEFKVNAAYYRDQEFQLDCTKNDTGSHASVRVKLGQENMLTISDGNGNWQGMADKNESGQIRSIIISSLARQFAVLEKDLYQGEIFKEEVGLS